MRRSLIVAFAAAAGGSLAIAIGALFDPTRALFSYLAAVSFALTLALGALFWVMLAHVTGALWLLPLRRLAESASLTVVPLALIVLPLSVFADQLYPWAGAGSAFGGSAEAAEHPLYYTPLALFFRSAACFIVWSALAVALFRLSRAQERSPNPMHARRQAALSGAGLPAGALALTLFAFDWLMPLDPEWRSTMYGVYVFAGAALSSLGLLLVAANRARALGLLPPDVGVAHEFAAAKMLLTFVLFWAYIGFSQFLIVWIADIPIESVWYSRRATGGFELLSAALVVLHFALPFLVLLSNRFKKRSAFVALLGLWLLFVHYLDVYWLVMPGLAHAGLAPHWLDAAALLQVMSACILCCLLWSRHDSLLPLNDPRLAESLALELVEP